MSGGGRCCGVQQFGKINVQAFFPPSGATFISVIFNQLERCKFLEVVVEVVPVNTEFLLQLDGAHFILLSQRDVG